MGSLTMWPTHPSALIDERAGRFWLYERTDVRRRGTLDMPADMVWLRLLGECDREGRIISTELAAVGSHDLTPFTPHQVSVMRAAFPLTIAAE